MTEPAGIEQTVETCSKGHPWTEENTLRRMHRANGKEREIRQCRACARMAAKNRRQRTQGASVSIPKPVPDCSHDEHVMCEDGYLGSTSTGWEPCDIWTEAHNEIVRAVTT